MLVLELSWSNLFHRPLQSFSLMQTPPPPPSLSKDFAQGLLCSVRYKASELHPIKILYLILGFY